ncbi:hypothetical protein [Oleidesulfovibrio sp.]|uniref:hypothetical protein n=1 Tax=Oleidesulfovibrio sp. TaxID=2909707 RepID=UPI003A8A4026
MYAALTNDELSAKVAELRGAIKDAACSRYNPYRKRHEPCESTVSVFPSYADDMNLALELLEEVRKENPTIEIVVISRNRWLIRGIGFMAELTDADAYLPIAVCKFYISYKTQRSADLDNPCGNPDFIHE